MENKTTNLKGLNMKTFTEFAQEQSIDEAVGGYKNAVTLAVARFIEQLPNREPFVEMLATLKQLVKSKKTKDIEKLFKDTVVGSRASQTAYAKLENYFYGVKTVTTSDNMNMANIDWASIDMTVDHMER
jgi:hypothetical protein